MRPIPALTGVRGVAALWVAGYHLLLPAGFAGGLTARLLQRGYLAVDLFFILSGFVIALNYGEAFRTGAWAVAFRQFIVRRAARLYPIYGTIVIGRFAYTAWRYGTFALPRPWISAPLAHPAVAITANLLLVQSWGIAASSIGPAWSISTEWGAYFIFPVLARLMLGRGPAIAWATAGAALLLIGATVAVDLHAGWHEGALDAWDGRSAGPIMRCVGGFGIGVGLTRLVAWPPVARVAGSALCGGLVAAALLGALAWGAPDLAIYPLFPALVLSLAAGREGVARGFAWAPAVWVGDISYSLYLLHIFLLHPLDVARAAARLSLPAPAADVVAPAIVFAALLAASTLSHRCIEQPGRTLMQRLLPASPDRRRGDTLLSG